AEMRHQERDLHGKSRSAGANLQSPTISPLTLPSPPGGERVSAARAWPGSLPELLPLDALPVHALCHQDLAHLLDRLPAPAHIGHLAIDAVDEAIDGAGELAAIPAPRGRG